MVSSGPRWSLEDPYDEAGNPVVVCPECEGTGRGEAETFFTEEEDGDPHCGVCCGFGRLDW